MKGKSKLSPNRWLFFVGFAMLAGLTFSLSRPNGGGEGGVGAALGTGIVFLICFVMLWLYVGILMGVHIKWLKNIGRPKHSIMKRRVILLGFLPLFMVLAYSVSKTFTSHALIKRHSFTDSISITAPSASPSIDNLNIDDIAEEVDGKFIKLGKKNPIFVSRFIKDGGCNVLVEFTSYASGIPVSHALAARAWLSKSEDVEKVYVIHWGFEGETSLCAVVQDENKRDSVVRDLNKVIRKEGKPRSGSFRQARILMPYPPPIAESDITQSLKYKHIEKGNLGNTFQPNCELVVNLSAYSAPLNREYAVFVREWLINREDVKHIYGIERSDDKRRAQSYASLCANGSMATNERIELMRDLKGALLIQYPETKRFSNIRVRKPNGRSLQDEKWTCELLGKKPIKLGAYYSCPD